MCAIAFGIDLGLQTASVIILPAAGIAGAVGMTRDLSILRPSQGFNAAECVGDSIGKPASL